MKYILVLLLMYINITVFADDNFYNKGNEYRGFYWFEKSKNLMIKNSNDREQLTITEQEEQTLLRAKNLTPDEAKLRLEQRKQTLEDARARMLELGMQRAPKEVLYAQVAKYKQLEEEMYIGAINLANSWEMVNFMQPDLVDNINHPVNVPGNRIKRKIEYENKTKLIRELANDFDLVLLTSSACPYCKEFRSVLVDFAGNYGFILEIADISGSDNVEQRSRIQKIIKQFGIDAIPFVIAIGKDGKEAFEFARGFMSFSELERNSELAVQMIKENLLDNRGK